MKSTPRPCVVCKIPTTAQSDETNGPRCLECGGCEHTKWEVCKRCGFETSGSHGYYLFRGMKLCKDCYQEEIKR